MVVTSLLLASALVLAEAPPTSGGEALDCRLANARVEAAIARKVAALHGVEYCQYRRYDAQSDVDGDGHDDLVVLFNVEPASGENDHHGFMALFLSSDAPGAEALIVPTGGRGERDAVDIGVVGRRITLGTLEYLPKDPMCCPSGHGTLTFELVDHRLRPLDRKARRKKE